MEEKYERIARFLESCTSLMQCDYRLAGAKITEILQDIASSKELTQLFTAVTKGFNYAAANRDYLRYPASPGATHGAAYLPAERKDVLAFVFCLLVEFDAGTKKLDDFLLRYFYVDGSYTAGFLIFTDRVIKPFRDIVADCFPELSGAAETHVAEAPGPAEADPFAPFSVGEEGSAAAQLIFTGLLSAGERRDTAAFTAMLAGYKYLLRFYGINEPTDLFAFAASL